MSGLLALGARADIAVISVQPTIARAGQFVQVRSGAYKALAAMPLYLIAQARAPRPHPCGRRRKNGQPSGFCEPVSLSPPHKPPFWLIGRLDFRRHPRDVRIRFRVPPVAPGLYEFVIYCDPCRRGKGGSLITSSSPSLRITR